MSQSSRRVASNSWRSRQRAARQHLRTSPDYALDSNEAFLDREIQDGRNSKSWIRDCASLLCDVRAEIRRRATS